MLSLSKLTSHLNRFLRLLTLFNSQYFKQKYFRVMGCMHIMCKRNTLCMIALFSAVVIMSGRCLSPFHSTFVEYHVQKDQYTQIFWPCLFIWAPLFPYIPFGFATIILRAVDGTYISNFQEAITQNNQIGVTNENESLLTTNIRIFFTLRFSCWKIFISGSMS